MQKGGILKIFGTTIARGPIKKLSGAQIAGGNTSWKQFAACRDYGTWPIQTIEL